MAKRSKKADDSDEHALATRDAWALGEKRPPSAAKKSGLVIDIPEVDALDAMEPEQLLEVAKDHHARGLAIYQRDLLPYELVVGLALRSAKAKVLKAGKGWTRWLESGWPGMSESTTRRWIGTAEAYVTLGKTAVSVTRTPAQLIATMVQGMRAIGCAELAKPAAREPRKPAKKAAPAAEPPIDAEYTVAPADDAQQAAWDAEDAEAERHEDELVEAHEAELEAQATSHQAAPLCANCGKPGTPQSPLQRLATSWEAGIAKAWSLKHVGCLHPQDARLARGEGDDDEESGPLDGIQDGEPYGTDDEDEPDLPDGNEDQAAPLPVVRCTCGHTEDEHDGPLGACGADGCFCDGFDGGADVEAALAVLWAAYREGGPARSQILRAIELLGDDPADAAAIDQELEDEVSDEGSDEDDVPDAGAPGPRPLAIETDVRASLAGQGQALSTEDRKTLAARLAENPLDVEAITIADDHGEVGALLNLGQRHWARARRVADELDRDAKLERPGVKPEHRYALLNVRHDLDRALERLKALARGVRPPDEEHSWPRHDDLNEAIRELREHPLRVGPIGVLAFRERTTVRRLQVDLLGRDVDWSQAAYSAILTACDVLDQLVGTKAPPSAKAALIDLRKALTPALEQSKRDVAERCGDGSVWRDKARKADQEEQRKGQRAKAAKTRAEKKAKADPQAPKVDHLPRGECSKCGKDVAVRRGGEIREHDGANGKKCPGSGKPARGGEAEPEPGDLVRVRWDPTNEKRALFVRWSKAGKPIVQVEKVDRRGQYTGEFGSERTFNVDDVLGVIERRGS